MSETEDGPKIYTETQMQQIISAAFDKGFDKGFASGYAQASERASAMRREEDTRRNLGRVLRG